AIQNVCVRNEPCLLKSLTRWDVRRITASTRNALKLVGKPLELLHEVRSEAAAAKWFSDFHVDIRVRHVVVKHEAAGRHGLAIELQQALGAALAMSDSAAGLLIRRHVMDDRTMRRQRSPNCVVKDDLLAPDVSGVGMQHDGQQNVAGLNFHKARTAG